MKTTTINLYNFDELSDEAKITALEEHNENNDFDFLSELLNEDLRNLLEENKINSDDEKLFYSLSYSQGDGVCFVGNFEYKGVNIGVKHDNGHYYHNNSVYIEAEEIDDDGDDDLKNDVLKVITDEAEAEFEELYKEICDKIEKIGYSEIEYENSEEAFKELCEANEYTFEKNGIMRNF